MPLTQNIRQKIWKRDNGVCQQCKVALTKEIDYYEEALEELGKITEIPIYKWKHECWKCGKENDIVSYNFIFMYNHSIGDIEEIDRELMKIYPFVKEVYSYTQKRMVIGNTCIHCGAYQGNFFVIEEMLEQFNEHGEEDLIDKNIPNMINFDNIPVEREDNFVVEEKITSFGHVHHKDRNTKNNNLENLILLCRICHIKTHNELRKAGGTQ
jgi:hypothetical protein